jgi:hypothetical protein
MGKRIKKQRRIINTTINNDAKTKRLADDDERLKNVMDYLWGTWGPRDVRRVIRKQLRCNKRHPLLDAVTDSIIEIHCSGQGYVPRDIARQMERIMLTMASAA